MTFFQYKKQDQKVTLRDYVSLRAEVLIRLSLQHSIQSAYLSFLARLETREVKLINSVFMKIKS